jgi:hypothetical protein
MHIRTIARDRRYLLARYDPVCLSDLPQINRMLAAPEEVAKKFSQALLPFERQAPLYRGSALEEAQCRSSGGIAPRGFRLDCYGCFSCDRGFRKRLKGQGV